MNTNPDKGPTELLQKVMFDIKYYFCQRGTENFQSFTNGTFQLAFNAETGICYIKKIQDEISKNHHEADQEVIIGFMPQLLNAEGRPHKMCPVRSFENYIEDLNPNIDCLWQWPLQKVNPNTNVWYATRLRSHNPIEKFMCTFFKYCELGDYYTNHCIRITGVTNLTISNFTPKQVMSITGHKSIQSLSIYQKVCEDDKLSMGISLTYSLLHPGDVKNLLKKYKMNAGHWRTIQTHIRSKTKILHSQHQLQTCKLI